MTRSRSRSGRAALAALAVPGFLFMALAICTAPLRALQAPPATSTIKHIRITRSGDLWTIALEADGPLPAPKIGELDAPPRVYLDFDGVRTTASTVTAESGVPILRVRAAVHSRTPLVSRVVVDLTVKQPIRTEAEQLDSGRFRILIGTVTPAPAEPSGADVPKPAPITGRIVEPPVLLPPPSPPPDTSGTFAGHRVAEPPGTSSSPAAPSLSPVPARSTIPAVAAKDAERYLEQVGGALERYRKLVPTLSSIDRKEAAVPPAIGAAREEFAAVLRALTALQPADAVKPVHDLLVRSASFALMAATLRQDAGRRADPDTMRNAASAAAGAMLLLDRVCLDLGCMPAQLPK
jgi:hypothetical protein